MKITYINTLYPPIQIGGAEKAVKLLAEAFSERGNGVSVISLHPEADELVEVRNNVQVFRMPIDNLYWPFIDNDQVPAATKIRFHIKDMWNRAAAKRIGAVLDTVKPDIVHTHNLNGFSVAAWGEVKKRKIPLVHTMHDYYLMCRRATLYRNGQICRNRCKDCSLMTTLSGRWSKELNAVISVSEFVLNEHRRYGYFPGVPGHVVYNVAHHDNPRNSESNVSASAQTLGFIGRLCEEKGIEVLLKAFQKIRSSEVRLRIAGTGSQDYVERLQREYQDARITWLGFTRSEDFYPSVGTVIIPSVWHDPLPYVAVETILAGKNLICSDSGGLPELARLTKKSALFRCADVSNLSEVIERVIADSSTARADVDGSASAEMNFDESAILAKHTQIYASL